MEQNILDDLIWRGLIGQTTDLDALRAALEQPISLYAGFDPTAASLHAGHLVPLLTLRRFQLAGHRPVVLSGGATGLIGDPRDVGERTMNPADTVADWADKIVGQLQRFVTIDDSAHGAVLVNNYEWTGPMTTIEFLRDVGKHFSVNVMLARDTVKRRLESDGISYTEFSYLLLQSNDYLQLFRRYGCVLQIGGSDQWGNIVGGVDLIRKVDAGAAHALTVPLVTSADGKKFGKSTGGGSVWLDPELTSPYSWYQYFVNTADADVVKFLKWFTFLSRDEIEELEQLTAEKPHLRTAQKRLAQELTTLIHGADQTAAAELASQALFGRAELSGLDEATLAAALGETGVAQFDAGSTPTIVELL
ncbi:tyrosine--tRNA ligase, partial [Gordonia sp. (in: high G+C Gram-positive bacteria)]